MKKTFRASLVAFAMAGLALAVAATDRVASIFQSAYCGVRDFFLDVVATVSGPVERMQAPAVRLVQAKAFVMRLVKRERPVVTNAWRMCPST